MPPLWPAAFLLVGALVRLGAAPAPLTGLRLLRTPEFAVSDLLGDRPDRACFTGTVVEPPNGRTVEAPFSGRRAIGLAYQLLEERSSGLWWLGFPFGSLPSSNRSTAVPSRSRSCSTTAPDRSASTRVARRSGSNRTRRSASTAGRSRCCSRRRCSPWPSLRTRPNSVSSDRSPPGVHPETPTCRLLQLSV